MGDVINLAQRIAERERRQFPRSTASSGGAAQVSGSLPLIDGSSALSSSGWATMSSGARRAQSRSRVRMPQSAAFFFDLSCPLSYLAAERVERSLGEVSWVPTTSLDRNRQRVRTPDPELFASAQTEAANLRLPLITPDNYPSECRSALRAAAFAAGRGAGARFALAAFRLAFCGGFDLDELDVIAEAAAAAGVDVHEALDAAGDPRWDVQPSGTARGLLGQGLSSVPAIRVGHRWFEGIDAVSEASLFTTFHVVNDAAGA